MNLQWELFVTSLLAIYVINNVTPAEGNESRRIIVSEERPVGSIIINLRDVLSSPIEQYPHAKFQILEQELKYPPNRPPPPKSKQREFLYVTSSGVVKQNEQLDRDELCGKIQECYIKARAIMQPQKHDLRWVELKIYINDVNDHDPVFRSSVIDLELPETAPINYEINLDRYQATDDDIGNNSLLSYTLSPSNGNFALRHVVSGSGLSHLQLVLVKQLDYEEVRVHRYTLTAHDAGVTSRSSSVRLKISVINVNDNAPRFEKAEYDVTLKEDATPGTIIERVVANDQESDVIRYSIAGSSDDVMDTKRSWPVTVDERTGFVTLRQRLDHKRHNGLRIMIEASDEDPVKPKRSKVMLLLTVTDVNDNKPSISINFIIYNDGNTAYVSESAPKSTYLAHVSATDGDQGVNGDVTITVATVVPGTEELGNLTEGGYFHIENNLLATDVTFNREKRGSYDVVISACDNGTPPKCSESGVRIVILDENEFEPIFHHLDFNRELAEDTEVGSVIAVAQATDGDSENSPAWRKTKDGVEVSTNGDVTYSLTLAIVDGSCKGGSPPIMIDPVTGKITLIRRLDYEECNTWKFTISARDGGLPVALESRRTLVIHVTDVNDIRPIFSKPPKDNMTIHASTMNGGNVFYTLEGRDLDDQAETHLKYSIKVLRKDGQRLRHKKHSRIFRLDSMSGQLRLRGSIGADERGRYETVVKAADSGIPPMTSSMTLYIEVIDGKPPSGLTRDLSSTDDNNDDMTMIIACALGGAVVLLILCVTIVALVVRSKRRKKKGLKKEYKLAENAESAKSDDEQQPLSVRTKSPSARSASFSSPNVITRDSRNNNICLHNQPRVRRASANPTTDLSCQLCDAPNSPGGMQRYIDEQQALIGNRQNKSPRRIGNMSPKRRMSSQERVPLHNATAIPVNNHHSVPSLDLASLGGQSMGEKCTELCKLYGHSDTCWMPNTDVVTPELPSPSDGKSPWLPGKQHSGKRKDSGCSVDTNSSISYYKMPRRSQKTNNENQQLPDLVTRTRHVTNSDVSSVMSSTNSSGASSGRAPHPRYPPLHQQRSPPHRTVKQSNSDSGYDVNPATEC